MPLIAPLAGVRVTLRSSRPKRIGSLRVAFATGPPGVIVPGPAAVNGVRPLPRAVTEEPKRRGP